MRIADCGLRIGRLATPLALVAALSARISAEEPNAVLADGTVFAAKLSKFSADWQIVLDEAGKTRTIAATDLMTYGAFVDAAKGPQILLADGGLLVADLVKADDEALTVDSRLVGEIKLPLECLRGMVLHPPADAQRRDLLLVRIGSASGDADRLILDNGDELTGTIKAISTEHVELQANVGLVQIETTRIAAIVFNPALIDRPKPARMRATVGLTDGSRLAASTLILTEKEAQLKTIAGTIKTKGENIRALQMFGGRATYLSDLKPTGYKHIPFLDLSWPYLLDRNCLGTQLRSGRAVYLKGIGMHSTSRLSFALSGQKRFAAEIGLDAQTGGRGSVTFRVFAENEEIFASPIVRGDASPLPVNVEIPAGAKALSLIVDFAERGDEQDHANWLNARLVD